MHTFNLSAFGCFSLLITFAVTTLNKAEISLNPSASKPANVKPSAISLTDLSFKSIYSFNQFILTFILTPKIVLKI